MIKQKITFFLLLIAFGISTFAQQEARRDRAESYSGTWGGRILHPTAYDKSKTPTAKVNAENFDIPTFMAQIDQLTTLNHVMINISRGHQSSWYSSPYPEMKAIMGSDLFPECDLFGELLDSLKSRGLRQNSAIFLKHPACTVPSLKMGMPMVNRRLGYFHGAEERPCLFAQV